MHNAYRLLRDAFELQQTYCRALEREVEDLREAIQNTKVNTSGTLAHIRAIIAELESTGDCEPAFEALITMASSLAGVWDFTDVKVSAHSGRCGGTAEESGKRQDLEPQTSDMS